MSVRYPENDDDVKTIVRAETGYEDTVDELVETDLDTLVERAKGRVELRTGADTWYSDDGLGFALGAYACMRAKAAMENVSLSSYRFGQEEVSFTTSDADTNQQLQQWAEDVRVGLDASAVDDTSSPQPTNTSGYVGETYIRDDYDHHTHY